MSNMKGVFYKIDPLYYSIVYEVTLAILNFV